MPYQDYDPGLLLNDWGGGNVGWWHGYISSEVDRCNSYWRSRMEDAEAEVAKAQAHVEARARAMAVTMVGQEHGKAMLLEAEVARLEGRARTLEAFVRAADTMSTFPEGATDSPELQDACSAYRATRLAVGEVPAEGEEGGMSGYITIAEEECALLKEALRREEGRSRCLQVWNDEALDALEECVVQACDCCGEPLERRLESMLIHAYADALRLLARAGRVRIVTDEGRRVVAKVIPREERK